MTNIIPYIMEENKIKFADQQPNVLSWQNLIFNDINLLATRVGKPRVHKKEYLKILSEFEKERYMAI